MKNYVIYSGLALLFAIQGIAQEKSTTTAKNVIDESKNDLYKFEIPAVLNGANIDPNPISNVNFNLTDSKISLKLGFPSFFKDLDVSGPRTFQKTGFLQVNFKASNGITTLYKESSPSVEYGITGGFSFIVKHTRWVSKADPASRTSERLLWINVLAGLEKNNLNMLNASVLFDDVKQTKRTTNGSFLVSLNGYFFSRLKHYRKYRSIWSIGAGYAKTNNYYALKKRTYEEGVIVYNNDSTKFRSVGESVSGAIGELKETEGLASYGELYIPLVRRDDGFGAVYFGNRLSFYGIGASNALTNFNSGFYVALKGGSPKKDVANFSVTGQFNQVNKRRDTEYLKNNFSVVLQAAIPLRLN